MNRRAYKIGKVRKTSLHILSGMIIIFILAAVFLLLTNKFLFKIKNVDIQTEGRYTVDDVLRASGIEQGGELFAVDIKKINENLKNNLPYIISSDVIRVLPSTIKITVKLQNAAFAIKLGGDYYVLSSDFYVIERISADSEEMAREIIGDDVIFFKTNAVKKCIVGSYTVFLDKDIENFLSEIFLKAQEYNIHGELKNIDIMNKFSITARFGDRFLVKFGTLENIPSKLQNLLSVINSLSDDSIMGIIDMSDTEKVSLVYNENIFG